MAEQASATRSERLARPLFLGTVVLGSFLLFVTQPMIARMALPRVGGAPAVWNSAMVVYQALLLGGYAYAHWLARLRPRSQAGIHLGLFAAAALWLPIGLRPDLLLPAEAEPVLWVPWFLFSSMGPLFFVVSAQAPLMQRWYALETSRGDPYPLYAVSNLGSFAGLVSYPLLVEPMLTLHQQSLIWSGGYVLLALLVAGCALTVPPHVVEKKPERHSPAPGIRRVAYWIALAAVPSGLMLSTTTHLTTDIVAVPLLWVLPLGLYLLSFVVAFARRRGLADFIILLAPLIILITGGLTFASGSRQPLFAATLGLSLLFVIAVALHAEMYRTRPAADRLTGFYLAMAVGGVTGGIFCALIAPTIFDWLYEHPLLILAAAVLLPQWPLLPLLDRLWRSRIGRWLVYLVPAAAFALSVAVEGPWSLVTGTWGLVGSAAIAVLALLAIGRRFVFAACLAALMLSYGGWWTVDLSINWDTRTRSYFGIYTIRAGEEDNVRTLTHGTTLHGLQSLDPEYRLEPTTYYTPRSGVGLAMRSADVLFGPQANIGVVGLGTGTLACYAMPGQDWRFYEIDPAMVEIATESGHFSFLSGCAPDARIVIGDARIQLSRDPAGSLDMLAVDAFSSDVVPTHLLTREAFGVYGRVLQPEGLLLVHISNRYVDLDPVVAAAAEAGGWDALVLSHYPMFEAQERHGTASIWVALSRDRVTLANLRSASGDADFWLPLRQRSGFEGWTDDYASILPLLKLDALVPFAK